MSDAHSAVAATAFVPLTREGIQAIELGSQLCGINQAETINNAVQLWAYLQELQAAGGQIWIRARADDPLTRVMFVAGQTGPSQENGQEP